MMTGALARRQIRLHVKQRITILLVLALCQACSPTASPPTRPPIQTSTGKTARVVPEQSDLPPVREPDALPIPELPLSRPIHEIPLPEGHEFEDLAGFRDRVWLLADDHVYEQDGTKITRELELCPGAEKYYGLRRYELFETDRGVYAVSIHPDRDVIVADFRSGVTVKCSRWPRAAEYRASDFLFVLVMQPRKAGVILPNDTRPLLGVSVRDFFGRAPRADVFRLGRQSLWLSTGDHLFRFDGAVWRRTARLPLVPAGDLWADPHGKVWAVLNYRPQTAVYAVGPGTATRAALGRYDGNAWTLVAVPRDFGPDRILGTDAEDMWFVGDKVIWQWDGKDWRRQDFYQIHRNKPPITRWVNFKGQPFMDASGSLWRLAHTPEGWRIFRTDPKPT